MNETTEQRIARIEKYSTIYYGTDEFTWKTDMLWLIEQLRAARKDTERLRKELWLKHGCGGAALYGDDGEMQCNSCLLDFKRNSVDQIVTRIWESDLKRGRESIDAARESQKESKLGQNVCDGCGFCCDHCECGPDGTPAPCDIRSALAGVVCKKCGESR